MKLFDIFFQNIKQQISFFIKPGSHRPWDKKNQEMLRLINPLYPKSVEYWISSCYTSVLYNRVVMQIKDMITQDEVNWHLLLLLLLLQWTLS